MHKRDDYVCAQGYVLGFSVHDDDIDINRVVFFTPSIEESDPLWRQYHLMRRYQSWQFSLFRLEPLRRAIAQANTITGVVFQEIMFMNAMAVQGKLARLPNIMTLQTVEELFQPPAGYRPVLLVSSRSPLVFPALCPLPEFACALRMQQWGNKGRPRQVHHILDAVHAVWLRYNFDFGVLNLATQQLLDAKGLDLPHPRPAPPWRRKQFWDVAHSRRKRGRYLWRRSVLEAEPREEIRISRDDIKRVEKQLDVVFA